MPTAAVNGTTLHSVYVLEDSGHFPWIDEPDAFFAAADRWEGS